MMTSIDMFGMPDSRAADIEGMTYPMECTRCGHIHDGAKVEVVQRYSDCSTWRCPGCNSLIDDRPRAWGGSAVRVERSRS